MQPGRKRPKCSGKALICSLVTALRIKPDTPSLYTLRRNQKEGALCTAEVVMELLQQTGFINEKEQLMLLFDEFNKR